MPLPPIIPPLINSANPWATTQQDLQSLYDCSHTGAVTTRTSLIHGFEHDDSVHQYTFFDTHTHLTSPPNPANPTTSATSTPASFNASLNTLGYSPIPLSTYLDFITHITASSTTPTKPFIISVTGTPSTVSQAYTLISTAQLSISNPLCMEINLSCPNIPDKPPPAYSKAAMVEYLDAIAEQQQQQQSSSNGEERRVAVGVKTPPYTYHDQFKALVDALLETKCQVDFVTATNTLGSCLVLSDDKNSDSSSSDAGNWSSTALSSASGSGIGGLAGAPLHPLALGNVKTIRGMLDREEKLRGVVDVIGVGGVGDRHGFDRMRSVGAKIVGVGTALGREGLSVFGKILDDGAV